MLDIAALARQGQEPFRQLSRARHRLSFALFRSLPTTRVFSDPDMLEAASVGRLSTIDRFWKHVDDVQATVLPRRIDSLRGEVAVPLLVTSCLLGTVWALASAWWTGARACVVAAYLHRRGRHEEARACLKERAFEVYCLLHLFEQTSLVATSVGLAFLALRTRNELRLLEPLRRLRSP
jgi:hypothetical protein